MTRRLATASLIAASTGALLVSGAIHPWLPIGCLLWLALRLLVFDRLRVALPEAAASLIQIWLALLFLWLGILREPPMDPVAGLLALCTPLLMLRTHLRRTAFNEFLEIVLALLIMVGSAAIAPGWRPLWIVAGWLGVACFSLPRLVERPSTGRDRNATRIHVRHEAGRARAAAAAWAGSLALGGLLCGTVFYLTMPRLSAGSGLPGIVDEEEVDESVLERRRGRRGTEAWVDAVARIGFPREMHIGDLGLVKRHEGIAFVASLRLHGRPYDPARFQGPMLLLRARAWDRYEPEQRRWTLSDPGRTPLPRDGTVAEIEFAPLHYDVSLRGYDGRTLFVPQRPARVLSASRRLLLDAQGGLHSVSPLRSYGVEAALPSTHPVDLRRLVPDAGAPASLREVPAALEADLRRLLPAVAPGHVGEAVEALRGWFERSGFRYTLELPAELPADTDPVIAFLERRTGHCELYASAACFHLRLHGIPARVVAGMRCSERLQVGVYRARMSNAHAWVEVACAGAGYVAFDFTPPDTSAARVAGAELLDGGDDAQAGADSGGPGQWIDWANPFRYGRSEQEKLVGWAGRRVVAAAERGMPLLLGAAVLLLGWFGLRARRRRPVDPLRVGGSGRLSRRVLAFYARWLKACAARGHRRRAAQTPREFLRSLPADLRREGGSVTAEFERRRYGDPSG